MELGVLQSVLKRYWGYDRFLPLQQEAMQCALDDHDSLVVMPTGGGKSLCYQAPVVCRGGIAVVVSPLIALMKDQVDALRVCGIRAAAIHSGLSADERRGVAGQIENGELRLLYVSPERLLTATMLEFLAARQVTYFAVDEAHCISAWGHDFRPEYRGLGELRHRLPAAAIHAYTATATEQVRADVIAQLGLREPRILVGNFHRPNLHYYVQRRERGLNQVCSVLDRFRGQSGIVYCITRSDVEKTCLVLGQLGFSVLPYHAGMSDHDRARNQESFLAERTDTLVATIAFGMGIDKSNVRYVVHAGMPRSLENYQQESGRAGRDGLEAECWLLYSGRDLMTWKHVIADMPEDARFPAKAALEQIYAYCSSVTCRHASLVQHFGQTWSQASCGACDVCQGKLATVDGALVIAQKILSCVLRVRERFGADYVSLVLCGSQDQRILANGHMQLSTWGILTEFQRPDVRRWIDQLLNQSFLETTSDYHVLRVTSKGHRLLKGEEAPILLRPTASSTQSRVSILDSWEGVDQALFAALRERRREVAEARGVPAYVVFSDATLRDMARRRPSNVDRLLDVHGVGQRKADELGRQFIAVIVAHCQQNATPLDVRPEIMPNSPACVTPSASAVRSFALFDKGLSIGEVAKRMERAASTVYQYLEAYIRTKEICDATHWIPRADMERVEVVVQYAGGARLKPIFDALHGRVSYDAIRIAVACLGNQIGGVSRR